MVRITCMCGPQIGILQNSEKEQTKQEEEQGQQQQQQLIEGKGGNVA